MSRGTILPDMDLNVILIWAIAVICLTQIVTFARFRLPGNYYIRPVLILIVMGLAVYYWFEAAGYIASLVIALQLIPLFALRGLSRSLFQKKFGRASFYAWIAAILHPDDGYALLPVYVKAIRLLTAGQTDTALKLLERLRHSRTMVGRLAQVVWTRQTGAWEEYVALMKRADGQVLRRLDGIVADGYLQSLGELSLRSTLLHEFSRIITPTLLHEPLTVAVWFMKLGAFCGDQRLVRQMTSIPNLAIPNEIQQFWRATAAQVAGDTEWATAQFEDLRNNPNRVVANAAVRRLETPLTSLIEQPLDEESQFLLLELSHSPILFRAFEVRRFPWASVILSCILVIVFLFELPGGSEDLINLIRMGGMLVPVELNGNEWWRPFTAAFLHFGVVHLAMNTLGLLVVGRQVEQHWGPWRTAITFLFSGVLAIYFAPYLMNPSSILDLSVLVGASGGVMGLIGCLLARSGVNLLRHRSRMQAQEFAFLSLIVIFQVLFDYFSTNVSGEAHLIGLGIGVLFGVLWSVLPRFSVRRQPDPTSRTSIR